MNLSLIICTYKRSVALATLLDSVAIQTCFPDSILIIDGSDDDDTLKMLNVRNFANLTYYKVSENERGLTKQRNFGVKNIPKDSKVISFLDDDTVLESDYFEQLLQAYEIYPQALGIGGYITNEAKWSMQNERTVYSSQFCFDGYCREEGARFKLRKKFGLDTNVAPGKVPTFSHGRSSGFLPPSGKIYPVQTLMGGNCTYRREVFDHQKFSTYFEGYGLYEDADFSIRLQKKGPLYVNTAARMQHHHDPLGRPNLYKYGKMVVKNGYYVWRVANPNPDFSSKFKWYAITTLLMMVRFGNIFTTKHRLGALSEALGRFVGIFSLILRPPKVEY